MHPFPNLQIFGDWLGSEELWAAQRSLCLVNPQATQKVRFVYYRSHMQQNLMFHQKKRGWTKWILYSYKKYILLRLLKPLEWLKESHFHSYRFQDNPLVILQELLLNGSCAYMTLVP